MSRADESVTTTAASRARDRSPYRQRLGADLLDGAVLPVPIARDGIRPRESNPLAGRYLEILHYAQGPAFPAQPPWGHRSVRGRVQGTEDSNALTGARKPKLTKVSIPTAQRDINDLIERGILRRNPGGSKNTSYDVADPPRDS